MVDVCETIEEIPEYPEVLADTKGCADYYKTVGPDGGSYDFDDGFVPCIDVIRDIIKILERKAYDISHSETLRLGWNIDDDDDIFKQIEREDNQLFKCFT